MKKQFSVVVTRSYHYCQKRLTENLHFDIVDRMNDCCISKINQLLLKAMKINLTPVTQLYDFPLNPIVQLIYAFIVFPSRIPHEILCKPHIALLLIIGAGEEMGNPKEHLRDAYNLPKTSVTAMSSFDIIIFLCFSCVSNLF